MATKGLDLMRLAPLGLTVGLTAAGCCICYLVLVFGAATTGVWFAKESLSFELAKGIPAAFVALVVGLIAGGIAYRQWQVARAKLKLDLFTRRLEVFKETEKFLLNSLPGGPNEKTQFIHLFPDATFLFGPEVAAYMRQAMNVRAERVGLDLRARANNGLPPELIPQENRLIEWLSLQVDHNGCRMVFAPYLDFSEWR